MVSRIRAIDAVCGSPLAQFPGWFMNIGVTRYVKLPCLPARIGKLTQRNFWNGAFVLSIGGSLRVLALSRETDAVLDRPELLVAWFAKFDRKPDESSRGGLPFRQFIASSAIPSPRCTLSVNGAFELEPVT